MKKERHPLINENKKLIRRAAFKYYNWMMTESKHSATLYGDTVLSPLRGTPENLAEMKKWITRFLNGISPRIQVDPWDGTECIGISNPDVYKTIATGMIPNLGNDIIEDINIAIARLKITVEKTTITPFSLKEAIEEIIIITKAWEKVSFRDDILSVLVTGVSLEDENETVSLGDFWVHLDLTHPLGSPNVESVDKIESENGFYHPHVSGDDELCGGDGDLLMNEALCQGRLEDYFRIAEAVLRTYNSNSPHENLCEWSNPSHEGDNYCDRCEKWRDGDSTYYCEGCDRTYCENCDLGGGCVCNECGEWRCGECSSSCKACRETSCYGCNENHCIYCLDSCISCNNHCCESCTQSCTNCGDVTCNDCMETCESCEDNCCSECIDKNCSECNKNICKECQMTCDHCGIAMCVSCLDEHKCLLAEIPN
jgi:hypothetical protein